MQDRRWLELDEAQQKAYIMHLLDGLEVVNRDKRLRVARAILYLAQGKDRIPRVWMRLHIRCLASAWGLGRSLLLGLCQVGAVKLLPGMVPCAPGVSSPLTSASLWASPGVFGDCDNEGDVLHWSRHNSFLLYRLGTFTAFLELLNMEIE